MKLSNYSKIFKALSNEQRLKIFLMIYNGCCKPEGRGKGAEFKITEGKCCPTSGTIEKAFTKACDCMKLSRSTISHHFKELQNAGLIISERDGRTFSCKVNGEAIKAIKELLK